MSSTVIIGAGIVGVSTAYYLSQHQPGASVHLVEVSPELFASASGYAAGFLAKDWFSPATASLGALSFKSTAHSRTGRTGPSGDKVDLWCRNGTSRADAASGQTAGGVTPPWLRTGDQDDGEVEVISDEGTVAQLDPLQLSQYLLQKCLDAGVHLHHPARAVAVQTDMRGEISSVRIEDTTPSTETDVPCTNIIITAGAWSPQAFRTLFPGSPREIPVTSMAGHSLVVRSPRWTRELEAKLGCHAVFVAGPAGYSPELFSRAGGTIYITGLNSATEPLPCLATEAKGNISRSAIERLRTTLREVLGRGDATVEGEDDLQVVREGLCFRPVTENGLPIIGRIPDELLGGGLATRPGAEGGIYLATGHGPWGISLSLSTGKVLAELVQGRQLSADISRLALHT